MPRPNRRTETFRLNLDLTRATKDRLSRLQEQIEARSLTEVISRALAVYEKLATLERDGNELIIRQPDGKELALLLVPI
jgi:hypothetical protein